MRLFGHSIYLLGIANRICILKATISIIMRSCFFAGQLLNFPKLHVDRERFILFLTIRCDVSVDYFHLLRFTYRASNSWESLVSSENYQGFLFSYFDPADKYPLQ
jgi:hypothetical protein